jgi:hypothetical protein
LANKGNKKNQGGVVVAPITGTDNENQGERQGIKGKIKGKEKKSKGNMEQMSRREI